MSASCYVRSTFYFHLLSMVFVGKVTPSWVMGGEMGGNWKSDEMLCPAMIGRIKTDEVPFAFGRQASRRGP